MTACSISERQSAHVLAHRRGELALLRAVSEGHLVAGVHQSERVFNRVQDDGHEGDEPVVAIPATLAPPAGGGHFTHEWYVGERDEVQK